MTTLLNYDFDKYEFTVLEDTDFIPIEEIEPDEHKRRLNYPSVTHQKKRILQYNIEGKKVTRKITTNKVYEKKAILERRKWKPFGDAAKYGNDGITTLGAPVFMEFTSDFNKTKYQSNKPIIDNKEHKPKKKGFTLANYKPSEENIKQANTFSSSMGKTGGYVPAFIKDKIAENKHLENFSIVVKNFPTHMPKNYLEQELKKLFKGYGSIDRIKVLTDKYTQEVKDIAFIDFTYPADALNLLNSNERFTISSCILSLEKSRK